MKKISLRAIDWCTIYFLLCFIVVVNVLKSDITINPDLRFLYNRALQMLNCIKDGNIPYFYYNDFGGVGYGSAFFYGHLTLYPFLIFVEFSIKKFLLAYSSVAIILTWWGSLVLCKRFTLNYKFISLLFVGSCFMIQFFNSSGTFANSMGVALSFFFLAFCVDFFRDSKSFIKATLLFYLIINTHTITALLSFIGCCLIMIVYFDKNRILDYFKFAILTILICSYFLSNILYHSDILTSTTNINIRMLDYIKDRYHGILGNYMADIFYLGTIDTIVLSLLGYIKSTDGFSVFNILCFTSIIIYLSRRFKTLSKRELLALFIIIIGFILANTNIWIAVNEFYLIPFQFPTRYMPYLLLGLLLICLRYLNNRKLKIALFIFSCFDLLLVSAMTKPLMNTEQYTDLFCQVINGEYLDKSFTWNINDFNYLRSNVTGDDNVSYDFDIIKNKVIVHYNGSSNYITVPKLYYRGYTAQTSEGVDLPLELGVSQFIKIDVSNIDNCTIIVQYKHPLLLVILNILCNCMVLVLFWNDIYKNYKKSK